MTRILVVEDEVSFSDPLSYLLDKEGYDVTIAENGPDAVTAFEADGADLGRTHLAVRSMKGGFSGGTIDSARVQVDELKADPTTRRIVGDPWALAEGPRPGRDRKGASSTGATASGSSGSMSPTCEPAWCSMRRCSPLRSSGSG